LRQNGQSNDIKTRTQIKMKMRQNLHWKTTALIVVLAILLAACLPQPGEEQKPTVVPTHEAEVAEGVEEALEAGSAVTVTVSLRAPDVETDIREQLLQIAQVQGRILNQVSAEDLTLVYQYQTMPALVGIVTSEGLDILRKQPEVQVVALDTSDPAALVESATLVRAHDVWRNFGLTGAGVNVALLDTGIDNEHPDLADNIVDQHCFVACPNDDSNNAQDDNGHGTHVAGIIASQGRTSPRGVAPDAGIVAVRIMDSTRAYEIADFVAGIDWVVANQARLSIRIVNLGMHSDYYSGVCDAEVDPRLVDAAKRARQAGIVIFAPAGNGGLAEMMSAPACVSGVISVGATDKADRLTWGSNSSSALDLLAPGELIMSCALGGGQTIYPGTSHASPHAAAVAALMLQANPGLSVAEIERFLKETGVPVTDSRNDRIRITPRIDALAAVTRVVEGQATLTSDQNP
jgi:subtilisin family serine protease